MFAVEVKMFDCYRFLALWHRDTHPEVWVGGTDNGVMRRDYARLLGSYWVRLA